MTAAVTDAGLPPASEGPGHPNGTEPKGTEHCGPGISGPGRPTGKPTLKPVLLGLGCSAAWLVLTQTMKQLHRLPPGTMFTAMAAGLRGRLLAALCISQTCWWTSVLVGLLNSTLRRWTGS